MLSITHHSQERPFTTGPRTLRSSERCLGRDELGTLQLQRQEGREVSRSRRPPRRSTSQQEHRANELYQEDGDSQIFQSPRGGASGAAMLAATSRSTSRSPAPCGVGPQEATGGSGWSRSPSKGPVGRHLAETKQPLPERHDSSGMILPEDFRQGDSGSSETSQHRLVILEDLLFLRLCGAV
jgi:hypothetical protein